MIPDPYYTIYYTLLARGGKVIKVEPHGEQFIVYMAWTVTFRDVRANVTKDITVPLNVTIPGINPLDNLHLD